MGQPMWGGRGMWEFPRAEQGRGCGVEEGIPY